MSCDSLLFYRGMDIGTAKPTAAEQAEVRHDPEPSGPGETRMTSTPAATSACSGSIGAVSAVLLWLAAAAGFGVYVRNFSHYGAIYGVAGTLIVLMLFLYLSNTAFLYGAELNAEAHRRQVAEDQPAASSAGGSP